MTNLEKCPQYPKAQVTIRHWMGTYYADVSTHHPILGPVTKRLNCVYSSERSLLDDAPGEMRRLINRMLDEVGYPKKVEIDLTPKPEPVKRPSLIARMFGA